MPTLCALFLALLFSLAAGGTLEQELDYWNTNFWPALDASGEAANFSCSPCCTPHPRIECEDGHITRVVAYSIGLSGVLEQSMSTALTKMEMMWLYSNQLVGTIPPLPPSIRGFWVHQNKLSGVLPNLNELPDLDAFKVHRNFLSGPIDTGPNNLTYCSLRVSSGENNCFACPPIRVDPDCYDDGNPCAVACNPTPAPTASPVTTTSTTAPPTTNPTVATGSPTPMPITPAETEAPTSAPTATPALPPAAPTSAPSAAPVARPPSLPPSMPPTAPGTGGSIRSPAASSSTQTILTIVVAVAALAVCVVLVGVLLSLRRRASRRRTKQQQQRESSAVMRSHTGSVRTSRHGSRRSSTALVRSPIYVNVPVQLANAAGGVAAREYGVLPLSDRSTLGSTQSMTTKTNDGSSGSSSYGAVFRQPYEQIRLHEEAPDVEIE